MLESFENDVARRDKKFKAEDAQSGMDILMRHYESELEKPLRSAITGTLPRSLLIQVRFVRSMRSIARNTLPALRTHRHLFAHALWLAV